MPQSIYKFTIIPTKIPASTSAKTDKLILTFMWKIKRLGIDKTIFKNKNKLEDLRFPISKLIIKPQ